MFTLASCVTLPDPESTQDFTSHSIATINASQSVGQTFISRRARLNGIDLWFKPGSSSIFTIELFYDPAEIVPIFSSRERVHEGRNHISIPALDDPPHQNYYLKISTAHGEAEILGRYEDAYVSGTAWVNGQPIVADLAFQATYEYDLHAAGSDVRGLLSLWPVWLPLGILLILPGWLLLDFTGWKRKFDFGECLALALGLSLALTPLLMLWTSRVGLHWGRASVWAVAGCLIATLVWRWFREAQESSDKLHRASEPANRLPAEDTLPATISSLHPSRPRFHAATAILVAVFMLALFLRFAMVRDLAAPAWVDSIHHGLIARLMLESGGIPKTYEPYLPAGANHYHFGFHSSLATFVWLTEVEIHTAMLILGQVLNTLMMFPIYLLTKTLTNDRPASLAAALIVSVFTLMPAYYASWGRYTQLTGLLVLPAAFVLVTKILHARDISAIPKRLWVLTALACAGLFLIHYRVTAFLGLLILAYLFAQVNPRQWLKAIGRLVILGFLSGILLLPWLPTTFAKLFFPVGIKLSGGGGQFSTFPWNFLKPGMGEFALVLAGIGLVLGIILLKRFTLTVILWTGFLYLLANLGVFASLPGAGFVNPVSMEITLFMPIAILGGFAIGGALALLDRIVPASWQFLPRVILLGIGAGASILGAQRLLPTLNPVTFLARQADFPAIRWISENLPEGENILINPAPWGYGLYMGNDGGYWISALSSHPTLPPPVIYGLGERSEITHINQTAEAIYAAGEDAAALWELMKDENLRYVYTGGRGGEISPQALSNSRLFAVRYQQNGTWVFEALDKTP